jgi:hypothetical protein
MNASDPGRGDSAVYAVVGVGSRQEQQHGSETVSAAADAEPPTTSRFTTSLDSRKAVSHTHSRISSRFALSVIARSRQGGRGVVAWTMPHTRELGSREEHSGDVGEGDPLGHPPQARLDADRRAEEVVQPGVACACAPIGGIYRRVVASGVLVKRVQL